jgi:CHAT domain-containing protein
LPSLRNGRIRPSTRVTIFRNHFQRETVVTYALLPQGPVAFVWNNGGMHVTRLPAKNAELESLSETFTSECSNPSSDLAVLDANSERLYRILIEPIASLLDPTRTLILEPDGALNRLPFQALRTLRNNYLNDEFRMVTSPAAILAKRTPLRAESKRWHVLAVGVTSSKAYPFLYPIPEAATEASHIGSLFLNATVLTNQAATRQAIFNALPGTELFHIATHTVMTPKGPSLIVENSRDVPGLINGFDLNSITLRTCKLAVLSACRTEGTNDRGIEASDSLVRAFVRAGIPEVVGSRWSVDSEVTTLFMNNFYSTLITTSDANMAIQKAAVKVREGKGTSHPFYWAGFSVFGGTYFQGKREETD